MNYILVYNRRKMPAALLKGFLLIFLLVILAPCSKQKEKPNILLVTIDTLRRDHLGIYGYPRQTSPFIDHLARNGLMFTHVITPIAVTAGSHGSILTSLHPLTHHCIKNGSRLPKGIQTIAEVLQEDGYYTIGTTAVNFLSGENHFNQGFKSFSGSKYWKRNAESVNKNLFQQVDKYLVDHYKKPLFIWVHYYDPHAPYLGRGFKFKEKIPGRYLGNPTNYIKNIDKYDSEIRYTDEAIKNLAAYLEQKGLAKKLVTCITADHGEMHGEHGYKGVHYDFYSESTFVPLIFHGYKIPKNLKVENFISTMDIAETLLSTAGLTFDFKTEGINLLSSKNFSQKDRGFLIICNPLNIKSLQFIRFPLCYIQNFDRCYKHWYISEKEILPGELFKEIKKENLNVKQGKLKQVTVEFSNRLQKNLKYGVVKVGLEKKNFKKKAWVLFNRRLQTKFSTDRKIESLTVFHPITPMDRYEFRLRFLVAPEAKLKNLKVALLSEQEFLRYSNKLTKLNNNIFSKLNTQRKKIKIDELYHLKHDLEMNKNLLKIEGFNVYKDKITDYRNSLYRRFEYYFNKGIKLLGRSKKRVKLTAEQIKMLESLGYI